MKSANRQDEVIPAYRMEDWTIPTLKADTNESDHSPNVDIRIGRMGTCGKDELLTPQCQEIQDVLLTHHGMSGTESFSGT